MRFLLHLPIAVAGAGCCLVLLAGRRERQGQLEDARRIARTGGFIAASGTVARMASLPWLPTLPWQSSAAALASGFVALLAGLSGKPRPSGYFAIGLFLLSLLLCFTGR